MISINNISKIVTTLQQSKGDLVLSTLISYYWKAIFGDRIPMSRLITSKTSEKTSEKRLLQHESDMPPRQRRKTQTSVCRNDPLTAVFLDQAHEIRIQSNTAIHMPPTELRQPIILGYPSDQAFSSPIQLQANILHEVTNPYIQGYIQPGPQTESVEYTQQFSLNNTSQEPIDPDIQDYSQRCSHIGLESTACPNLYLPVV